MPHPSDQGLILTVGPEIQDRLERKIEALIRSPDQRTAGYIDALRDVQALLSGQGDRPPIRPPTQETRIG